MTARNNRVLEEIKNLSKLRNSNLKSFDYTPGPVLIQTNTIFFNDDQLYKGEVEINGTLLINYKVKAKPEAIKLTGMSIWIEKRPRDENREKAITSNYLRWSDDQRLLGLDFRMVVQVEQDLKIKSYVRRKTECRPCTRSGYRRRRT